MKYLTILFLFIFEFTMGQIPGMPRLMNKRTSPLIYTISYSPDLAFTKATIKAQAINSGNSPIVKSGILWSTGIPTYDQYSGRTEDGATNGDPYQAIFTSLPTNVAVFFRAYAITSEGEYVYGNTLSIPSMTVQNPLTGIIWMARNLGATADPQVSPNGTQVEADTASYGYLYQWGRGNDGHQYVRPYRNLTYNANGALIGGSGKTQAYSEIVTANYATYSNIPVANRNKFISNVANTNWLTSNTTAWQYEENNPCPSGFHVPHSFDFNDEFYVTASYSDYAMNEVFASVLRLPVTGYRDGSGNFANYFAYNQGRYWTRESIDANTAKYFLFIGTTPPSNGEHFFSAPKNHAYAVRCRKY